MKTLKLNHSLFLDTKGHKWKKTSGKHVPARRRCNLCRQPYKAEFAFQRFCRKCRTQNDSFLFHEWLPTLPEGLVATA